MRKPIIFLLFGLTLSCSDIEDKAYPNKTHVMGFKQTVTLEKTECAQLDLKGMIDIHVYDSILVVSTQNENGFVTLLDASTLEHRYSGIVKGRGPGELMYPFYFSSCRFFKRCNQLFLDIPCSKTMKLTWNVSTAFSEGTYDFTTKKVKLPKNGAYLKALDDSTYFMRIVSEDERKLERVFYSNGSRLEVPTVDVINELEVQHQDGFSFNLLSGLPVFNEITRVFAEASLFTNRILFFSMDGTWKKSIIIGKKTVTTEDAEKYLYDNQTDKQYFLSSFQNDEVCAFLYHEVDYSILVFDWDGNPVKKIILPHSASTFCFNDDMSVVYTLDSETEELFVHKLS